MERHVQDKLNNVCASGSRLCVVHFIDSVCVKKTSSLVVIEKKILQWCEKIDKTITFGWVSNSQGASCETSEACVSVFQ